MAEQKTEATKAATPQECYEHLKETGTPNATLEMVEAWIRQNPQGTGEQLLAWVVQMGVTRGTVEKVGRFVRGRAFQLASSESLTVSEKEDRLLGENDNLRRTIKDKDQENMRLRMEIQSLRERLGEQTEERAPERLKRGEQGFRPVAGNKQRAEALSLPVASS